MTETPSHHPSNDERPAFIAPDVDYVECFSCGQNVEDLSRVDGVDVSGPDEYYPEMKPVCPDCQTEAPWSVSPRGDSA